MREAKTITVTWNDTDTMTCTNRAHGWECEGTINGVHYKIFAENSAPTRVFQIINSLYEAQP